MTRLPFDPKLVAEPAGKRSAQREWMTVSQVTALVKQAIETAFPPTVHVIGEISNFKRHGSGHLYFTLKDSASELSCVVWKSSAARLTFRAEDGMEVVATGGLEVFERAGRYQLYVRKLDPRGVGALELAFRQLYEKLNQEGLFDPARKKAIPRYPDRIVVITSPSGAAVADILGTIQRRYPCVAVLVFPVRVQGDGAAGEIAAAIRMANANRDALGGVDVMIVGRGGGSLEDLWAFNEEPVVRAVHASRIPVICAVGHEVNVTLAELAADVRAATPTAAAELAVPVLEEVLAFLAAYTSRLNRCLAQGLALSSTRLESLLQRSSLREPLAVVFRRQQIIDEWSSRMHRALVHRMQKLRQRMESIEPLLQRIAPHAALFLASHRLHDLHAACRIGLQVRLAEVFQRVQDAATRIPWSLRHRLSKSERVLAQCSRRWDRASPEHLVVHRKEQIERLGPWLFVVMQQRMVLCEEQLLGRGERIAALSYRSILNRGFSITRDKRGGAVIRSVEAVGDGDRVMTEVADGRFESKIVNLRQMNLFD